MDSYSDLGLGSRPQVMDLMSYAIWYHPWNAMATGLYPISLVIGMIPTRDKVPETLMRIHGSSNGWSGPPGVLIWYPAQQVRCLSLSR